MDFIYRLHLVDFNPMDDAQIEKHWNWIKKAISYSSSSLYRKINTPSFNELDPNSKKKIIKYLLRGRYRSTPFGLWAGVGVGNWSETHQINLPLTYQRIESQPNSQNLSGTSDNLFKIAPGLKAYSDQVQYWTYCPKEEGWRISYLDKNPLIVLLLKHFQKSDILNRQDFNSFFESKNQEQIDQIWKMLLQSGILIPSNFPSKTSTFPDQGIDIKLTSRISIKNSIKKRLDQLSLEIGNLFLPVESEFLKQFKNWFQFEYDDRFVPVSKLSHFHRFSRREFDLNKPLQDTQIPPSWLFTDEEEIDLSIHFPKKELDLQHLQLVFKLFGQEGVYIENMVCNRPFAYSGRFSLDPEIKKVITQKLDQNPKDIELADLFLFESTKSNHITRYSNAFNYSIYPFGHGTQPSQLGIEDLLLGLRDGRLILYSQKLKKQVIPVNQHPLSPTMISHPLSRLLWEIGNQDQYRFFAYHHDTLQRCGYLPRLSWRGLILQGRRWVINSTDYPTSQKLHHYLVNSPIPEIITAGHLDRELVLDWTDKLQFEFLYYELQRMGELSIYECPWKDNSPFQNLKGEYLYPQLIYSWTGKRKNQPVLNFLNRIEITDTRWVYTRIFINEIGVQPFLHKTFPSLMQSLKESFIIDKWYFLTYQSPQTEIRLRVLPQCQQVKTEICHHIQHQFSDSAWVENIHFASYYPEIEKYGGKNQSMENSESIFHMESEMIIFEANSGKTTPVQSWSAAEQRSWVIHRYFTLIQKSGYLISFFEYFQKWVKGIPLPLRKTLAKTEFEKVGFYPGMDVAERVENGMISIAKLSLDELLRIIPNHIHLCCNRTFSVNTQEEEQRVIYGIYKILGKHRYGMDCKL